mmetsp:Transcript_13105/g.31027  ORF Transcript_13105/g.31027 Transcript_13105/m.31027 type:complete len:285 (+) Transcript_13105:974-1828(+)
MCHLVAGLGIRCYHPQVIVLGFLDQESSTSFPNGIQNVLTHGSLLSSGLATGVFLTELVNDIIHGNIARMLLVRATLAEQDILGSGQDQIIGQGVFGTSEKESLGTGINWIVHNQSSITIQWDIGNAKLSEPFAKNPKGIFLVRLLVVVVVIVFTLLIITIVAQFFQLKLKQVVKSQSESNIASHSILQVFQTSLALFEQTSLLVFVLVSSLMMQGHIVLGQLMIRHLNRTTPFRDLLHSTKSVKIIFLVVMLGMTLLSPHKVFIMVTIIVVVVAIMIVPPFIG